MTPPVLKWAGGKRWLVKSGRFPTPNSYKRYVEPFVGGGAAFFHLQPKKALLSDANPELICLYETIRDRPVDLLKALKVHHRRHSSAHYYAMRAKRPRSALQIAARFLYLNRTCWNGLYRVNLKGEFNVPIGTKETVIFDTDDFQKLSKILRNATIRCSDFEPVLQGCGDGDFVFVDPPYTVQHNCNGFLKYNETIFSWSDQQRLFSAVRGATQRGASVVVTNADHPSIRELYSEFGQYIQLSRHSVLAGDASRRRATTEAMFIANI